MTAPPPLKVAVVGAGNIGSRHLQAVAALGATRKIAAHAVDVSSDARAVAAARFEQAGGPGSGGWLATHASLDELAAATAGETLDVLILATGARGRLALLRAILAKLPNAPRHVMLEKVVFDNTADWAGAEETLAAAGVPSTVVNIDEELRAMPCILRARQHIIDRGEKNVKVGQGLASQYRDSPPHLGHPYPTTHSPTHCTKGDCRGG
jgi:predicted dehydrogenase